MIGQNKEKRWQEAQAFEYTDWANVPNIVKNEWRELEQKYKVYFEHLSSSLRINEKTRILDVGCGPTCISRLFKKGQKFGVDPLAEKLGLVGEAKGVKVFDSKGENLPFGKESFDIVVCRNAIDHTENPQKVVEEIRRVLKKKGYFILSCYVYTPFIKLVKQMSEFFSKLRNVGHPHTFSLGALEGLAKNNFKIIERKVIHTGYHPNDYAKVDEQIGYLSPLQRLIIFLNFRIIKEKWFLKEYCLLLRKN